MTITKSFIKIHRYAHELKPKLFFYINDYMTLTLDLVTLTLDQLERLINIDNICKYHKIHPSVHDLWAKNTRCKRAHIHTDRPTNIQTKAVKY